MTGPRRIRAAVVLPLLTLLLGGLMPDGAKAAAPTNARLSISDTEAEANALSTNPTFSADGRFVAFASDATNLVSPATAAGVRHVYVRDRVLGTTEIVSVDTNEVRGDGNSDNPRISAGGRFIVFDTFATNLNAGVADTNGAGNSDIFIRDRTNGTTQLVNVNNAGAQAAASGSTLASVSEDGNFVSFSSTATNLVTPGPDTNGGLSDVFVRNRSAGTTTVVSVDNAGAQSAAFPSGVKGSAISADGNFVAFESGGLLVSGDGNGAVDVFVRDRVNNRTERVSTTAAGAEVPAGAATTSRVDISAEGRFVVFESGDTTLVSPDAGGFVDVFRKDRTTGAIIRASQKSDGTQADASSGLAAGPVVSPDGRFVAFPSSASNLVSTSTDSAPGNVDIFVHDAITRQTVRVSEGSEPNGPSNVPTISGGSEAAFASSATNLVSPDTNGAVSDVFSRHFRRPVGSFVLDNLGGIFTFGTATFRGSVPALRAAGTPVGNANIVDLEVTPSGNGYYVLDDAGGIFTFGDAAFFGSVPGLRASGVAVGPGRILDMAVTPSGQGYLILDDAGGIFTFGDAAFFGSIPQLRASGVAIGSARGVDLSITPNGRGYLILDDTGGIFTFGDGAFFGSLPGLRAGGANIGSAPSIRMAVTPSGNGYLVLDSAGGMFTFGDAQFFGSIPGLRAAGTPIGNAAGVDLAMTPTGNGYIILDDQGGMFTFGDGEFFGSIPALRAAGVAIGPNSSIRVDLVSSLVGG